MMLVSWSQTPSYKTINLFRVNPNTDALIESLFIQFHNKMHIKIIEIGFNCLKT